MHLLRPVLDIIFFRNPVIILVLSFLVLYLAVLVDGQDSLQQRFAKRAIETGPPELIRIEAFPEKSTTTTVQEMNLLAEIDPSDYFEITVGSDGKDAKTKYIVPLYAATKAQPEETATLRASEFSTPNERRDFNKSIHKQLIGAIVSDDQAVFKNAHTLSDGFGLIGSIVKVNGQSASFDKKHEAVAKQTLAELGIEYGKYGEKPVYIDPFFDKRNALLQQQATSNVQSNALFILAYTLIAIAYYRSMVEIVAIFKGQKNFSIIDASIQSFSESFGKPTILKASDTKAPSPFGRLDQSKRLKTSSKPANSIFRT